VLTPTRLPVRPPLITTRAAQEEASPSQAFDPPASVVPAPLPASSKGAAPAPHASGLPPGYAGCLATSYTYGGVVQAIDLVAELSSRGLTRDMARWLLDAGLTLGLSVWVAAPAGGIGIFELGLQLDDGRDSQQLAGGRDAYCYHSGAHTAKAGAWGMAAHVVDALPRGTRRARIVLRGRDATNRAGNLGVRIMAAELSFVARNSERLADLRLWEGFWEKRRAAAAAAAAASRVNPLSAFRVPELARGVLPPLRAGSGAATQRSGAGSPDGPSRSAGASGGRALSGGHAATSGGHTATSGGHTASGGDGGTVNGGGSGDGTPAPISLLSRGSGSPRSPTPHGGASSGGKAAAVPLAPDADVIEIDLPAPGSGSSRYIPENYRRWVESPPVSLTAAKGRAAAAR